MTFATGIPISNSMTELYTNMRYLQYDTLTVTVDVTNTGSMEGKEIVQLYIHDLTDTVQRPLKELKGYDKVSLKPGETKTVSFTLDYRSFAWYSTKLQDWYAKSGNYEILVGASSRDIRLSGTVHLTTAKKLPLHFHMNTTLGELLSDERTLSLGLEFKRRMDAFIGDQNGTDIDNSSSKEAISDAMNNSMIASMPLRNLITFGLISKEELQKMMDEI